MRQLPALALVVASAVLFAGCNTTKLDDKPAVVEKPVATETAKPVDNHAVVPMDTGSKDDLNTNPTLANRSVYFDFDAYVVKDEFAPVVTAHGKYLSAHKERKVIIQGNTDERGGSEYNLALGQKRAEAVRKSLSVTGVAETQMEAVSLGKEKPKAAGHDEAAWAQNRRADIVYN
jgi:peptidoglycan-associated lipoprotein